MVEQGKKLRIAVIGVGMGGTAIGLDGSWIGVTNAGQKLLDGWLGASEVDKLIDRKYSTYSPRHWKTGEILYHPKVPDVEGLTLEERQELRETSSTIRSDLHLFAYNHLPKDRIHMGKKAIGFGFENDEPHVNFSDGTKVYADIIVAADGVNSRGRFVMECLVPDSEGLTLELRWGQKAPDGLSLFSLAVRCQHALD
ncbi:unnamed protein product [Clonostachys rosea]|uniref:FAD-binding domain-containing protein n=1 Tax=Bionectria ochroleuca TaxID=29856 RepID=A0ABY6U9P7_BIOOC|nr:unnamed protein product [Clonostachys rosea]